MKRLWMILTFCLFVATPVKAQEATITINGYGWGRIEGIGHDCPIRTQGDGYRMEGYVGAQISCPVWGVDADSIFTPASMSVVVSDSSRISALVVHSARDSLGNFYPDTLKVQILRNGNWHIDLNANPVIDIFGYMFERNEYATWPRIETAPEVNILIGEQFALCGYQLGWREDVGYVPVAKTYNRPDVCPDPDGSAPLPEFEVNWILPDILERADAVSQNAINAMFANGDIKFAWPDESYHAVPIL